MIWADWDNVTRTQYIEIHKDDGGNQFEEEMPVRVIGFVGGQSGPFLETVDAWPVRAMGIEGAAKSLVPCKKKCHFTAPASALAKILEDWNTGEEAPTTLHAFTGWTL
jgi:hypothetical protein